MKAQYALLGIVFIVVILIFGVVFYLFQSLKSESVPLYQRYHQSQLAANTLYTLMKTTLKCNSLCSGEKLRMDELIKNCVKADDCSMVSLKLQEYLDFTFANKGINYKFNAVYSGTTYIELQEGYCRDRETGFLFIPLDDKNIRMSLEICY